VVSFAPTDAAPYSNVVVFTTSTAGAAPTRSPAAGLLSSGQFPRAADDRFLAADGQLHRQFQRDDYQSVLDFGDGSTTNTSATNLTHSYAGPSTNTVRLTATGPVGISTVVSNGYIVVTNLPPKLVVSPTNLDFGPVVIGQSRTQVFCGVQRRAIGAQWQRNGRLPFSVVGGTPFSVGMSQTGLVQVVFYSNAGGQFECCCGVQQQRRQFDNCLSGVGLAPAQLAVSPAGFDFGTVAVGASAQTSFVATNLGDVTLSKRLSLWTAFFSIVAGNSFNLSGHTSTNVVIQFAPVANGVFSNNVVFLTSNAGSSTNTVTGTGATIHWRASRQSN